MARSQLDFRKKYVHDSENGSSLVGGFVPGAGAAAAAGPLSSSFAAAAAATMDSETSFIQPVSETASSARDRLSRAFGPTKGEDLVMAEASAVPIPPGQDARAPERGWGDHVSIN